MVDYALIFPGQGAQYVGMGKELYDNFPAAKVIYAKADNILGFDMSVLCFSGPKEELIRTEICQPAILITSIAALRALEAVLSSPLRPKAALGLSLGEYTALVAAGSLAFEDAVQLVRRRGQFMEEASRLNPGTMASVIGLSLDDTKRVCADAGVQVANLNSPGQIVISGAKDKIEAAAALAKERGAKKVIPLDVSGAFHSVLMQPAVDKLKTEIEGIKFAAPKINVITNVTAGQEYSPEEIRWNLVEQVKSSVLWEESIRNLAGQGVKRFIEVGPGKILNGLLRRIEPALECFNVETAADVYVVKEILEKD